MTSSNIIQLNNSIWESGSAAEKRTFLPVETRLVSNQRTSRCDNEAEKREQIRSDRIRLDSSLLASLLFPHHVGVRVASLGVVSCYSGGTV